MTGLALPALDLGSAQYGSAWAAASSGVFADLMRHSVSPLGCGQRSAAAGTAPNGTWGYLNPQSITWRPDGYPAGLSPPAGSIWSAVAVIAPGTGYYSPGRYVLLWDGNGTVVADGDAGYPPLESAPGRQLLDLQPGRGNGTGIRLRIVASSPADPLLRLRLVPAELEAGGAYADRPFAPAFLQLLSGIPLLRFTAWMRASSDPNSPRTAPRDWAARTTLAHASQVREADGVAVELLVALANAVNASMWLSLPRPADGADAYVAGMVGYVAAQLSPQLGVVVEYGTEGPGWLGPHLPNATRLLAAVARRAWAAAGRPAGQLRVIQAAPAANVLMNEVEAAGGDLTHLDALAMPASFGGRSHWVWSGLDCPTAWGDPAFLAAPQRAAGPAGLQEALGYIRSSVLHADVAYNKALQQLGARGLPLLGYAAGPELAGPNYGARSNYDRVLQTCGWSTTAWPCTFTNPYPPWGYSGGPGSITWSDAAARNASLLGPLAANASREAAMEAVTRAARQHSSMYDMMADWLWRWHGQMGAGDLVVDLGRTAARCDSAPGSRAGVYAPEECRTPSLVVATPTDSPTYRALRDWVAATGRSGEGASPADPSALPGALPRSSATAPPAVPPAPACASGCVYGSCVGGSCRCWAGAGGPGCGELTWVNATPAVCNPAMGINLEGISDWSRSWTFVDVFKAARDWIRQTATTGPWSVSPPLPVINATDGPGGAGALGYPAAPLPPNSRASTLVMRDLQGHIPGGVYTVLWDGRGALDFSMSDVRALQLVEAGHARVTFVPSSDMNNGILVSIERSDPADPIRNIRVLTPGLEAAALSGAAPFHPALLEWLRPYGTLRFMDWMRTNDADPPTAWPDRPTPATAWSYAAAPGGVPLELMLQLANSLGAAPWFCLPAAADDDYVANFAAAVAGGLRPDVGVVVELGNELWHTGFPGGQYAQAQGLAMNLTEQGAKWPGGLNNEARLCWVAHRTANISRMWREAFGPDQAAARLRVVVSAQAVWPLTASKLLSCGGPAVTALIDAVAIAPYFGSYDKTRDTNLTTFMTATLPAQIDSLMAQVREHAAIAAAAGKPLWAYEAGQGLTGDGSSTDLAIQANRHPAMAALYTRYLAGLAAAGVSRTVHFSSVGAFSRYGAWGLAEWQDQDPATAPKQQGLLSYLNANLLCPLPPPPDPAACPAGPDPATPASSTQLPCSGRGTCLAGGTCACYAGYSGEGCSVVTYTEVYDCGYKCTFDQGSCNISTVSGFTRTWTCACKGPPGLISGRHCSIVSCPNDCSWNGECLDVGVCSCYPGYSGADCSVDCGCGGHGTCDGAGGCVCDVGWRPAEGGGCEWDCSGCAAGTACIGPGECGCAEACVYGDCVHGACRCWAGYGGPRCSLDEAAAAAAGRPAVPRLNRGSAAGVNLGGPAYWSTEWVWTDLMKGSSGWMTANSPDTALENPYDTGVALDLWPDNGYPARLPPNTYAHKLLQRNLQLHAWPGRYVVLHEGEGRLDFGFDATVVSRAKGRLEIQFSPTADLACAATGAAYCGDNGIALRLLATNPGNPLRNIRILPSAHPGAAASAGGPGAGGAWEGRWRRAPFHPWFLKSLARYRLLRFMTWQATNTAYWAPADSSTAAASTYSGPGASQWGARVTPAFHTQAVSSLGGVAAEHIAQLVNVLGADAWLCAHHTADNATVAALAALLRDRLRPDVAVYVEHSNEVWNSLFPSYAYAVARGRALGLAPASAPNATVAYRYHALRTVQIGAIFKSVFADAPGGGSGRVRVVLGGWGFLCNNGAGCGRVHMNETLGWRDTARQVDYYGVTAYWDCGGLGGNGPADVLLSVEQMIDRCNASLPATEAAARALVAAAAPYGVPLITYEAGPSLVEAAAIQSGRTTAGLAAKLVAAARHPAMYDLYRAHLAAAAAAGLVSAGGEGRPYMQFVSTALPGQYGSWGLQEYTGQPASEAHKYRALMDWLDEQSDASGRGLPPRRPLCVDLMGSGGGGAGVSGTAGGGGVGLGEGVLSGPPAVWLPAAGSVWLLGLTAPVRWSTVGFPAANSSTANSAAPVDITLWRETDCAAGGAAGSFGPLAAQQKPSSQALLVLASGLSAAAAATGRLDVRLPLPAQAPAALLAALAAAAAPGGAGGRFFVRLSDGLTANYSEPFDIAPAASYTTTDDAWTECDCAAAPAPAQRRNLSCTPHPRAPAALVAVLTSAASAAAGAAAAASLLPQRELAPVPQPRCGTFYVPWNLTQQGVPGDTRCAVAAATGCRTFRTSNQGQWAWSAFKPVDDCTASDSPWPAAAAAAAAPGPASLPLSLCATWDPAPPPATNQTCPADACPSPPPEPPSPEPPSPAPPSPAPPSTSASQWTCDAGATALTQRPCTGLCRPQSLRPLGARLTEDGRTVRLSLSAPAAPLAVAGSGGAASPAGVGCGQVFAADTAALLGGAGAVCWLEADSASSGSGSSSNSSSSSGSRVLVARLAANSAALPGLPLYLRGAGGALVWLRDRTQPFTGDVMLDACDPCAPPRVVISGPAVLTTAPCESPLQPAATATSTSTATASASASAATVAQWDASASADPAGRAMAFTAVRWSVPEDAGSPGGRAVLAAAAFRTNFAAERLVLALSGQEVAQLEDGLEYRIKVEVTSWLGSSASATATFRRAPSAALPPPPVTISGGSQQSLRLGGPGLRLGAEVAGGGCRGRSLAWRWSLSPASPPLRLSGGAWGGLAALPAAALAGQSLYVAAAALRSSGLSHGDVLVLRLTASYTAGNGSSSSSSAAAVTEVDVSLAVVGSEPVAALALAGSGSGSGGDVLDNVTLVLDAAAGSYDPDLAGSGSSSGSSSSSARAGLSYSWGCVREDAPAPCFGAGGTPQAGGSLSADGGVWSLAPGLLAAGRSHTFTVTVTKSGAADGAAPLAASASLTLRPRAAAAAGAAAFPRAALSRQCAAAACGAPHPTDRDLVVLLRLLPPYDTAATAAAVNVTWSSPDAAAAALGPSTAAATGDTSAQLLTVPAAALPAGRSSITLAAALTLAQPGSAAAAAAASGQASITVPLDSAPYCGRDRANPSQCLALTLTGAFPTAAASLRAQDWVDDGAYDTAAASSAADTSTAALRYEFGVVRRPVAAAGSTATATRQVYEVRQVGAAAAASLGGLPVGDVALYCCAVDAAGARACAAINVTVAAPSAGGSSGGGAGAGAFDASAALAALDVSALSAAGDRRTLLTAAYQAAALLSYAGSVNGSSSGNSSSSSTSSSNAAALSAQMVANQTAALVSAILGTGGINTSNNTNSSTATTSTTALLLADADEARQVVSALAALAAAAAPLLPDSAKEPLMAAARAAMAALAAATSSSGSSSSSSSSSSNAGAGTDTDTSSGWSSAGATEGFVTELCRLIAAALPTSATGATANTSARRAVLHEVYPARHLADTSAAAGASAGPTAGLAVSRLADLAALAAAAGGALGRQAVPGGGPGYLAAGDVGLYVSAGAPLLGSASPASSAASAGSQLLLSAGPEAVAAAAAAAQGGSSSGSSSGRHRSRELLATASATATASADAYLVLAGAVATGAAGYSLSLTYAPSASAAVAAVVAAAAAAAGLSPVTPLGGLAAVSWSPLTSAAAAGSPPALDGSSSYLQLRLPVTLPFNASRTTACLAYDPASGRLNGSLAGVALPAGSGAASPLCAFERYDAASGRVVCRCAAVGSYVAVQGPEQPRPPSPSPGSPGSSPPPPPPPSPPPPPPTGQEQLGAAAPAEAAGPGAAAPPPAASNTGAIVGGVVGGVLGAAALAALALFVVRRRRRGSSSGAVVAAVEDGSRGGGGGKNDVSFIGSSDKVVTDSADSDPISTHPTSPRAAKRAPGADAVKDPARTASASAPPTPQAPRSPRGAARLFGACFGGGDGDGRAGSPPRAAAGAGGSGGTLEEQWTNLLHGPPGAQRRHSINLSFGMGAANVRVHSITNPLASGPSGAGGAASSPAGLAGGLGVGLESRLFGGAGGGSAGGSPSGGSRPVSRMGSATPLGPGLTAGGTGTGTGYGRVSAGPDPAAGGGSGTRSPAGAAAWGGGGVGQVPSGDGSGLATPRSRLSTVHTAVAATVASAIGVPGSTAATALSPGGGDGGSVRGSGASLSARIGGAGVGSGAVEQPQQLQPQPQRDSAGSDSQQQLLQGEREGRQLQEQQEEEEGRETRSPGEIP
ncbi:hypothetical protein HXX76_015752 [Chlamydomonas incerta]|uniref:EGF-like domain-containing protein n=1 Tax=Chlamydomonas incerta TaxID=51695 RepID=A0A835SLF4_CHLIN|nr:hypothetical protein HXX76_015752 [Chlamydomonas incerta]|eukprot:KAG2422805.1 hypothetical protein HXX76_015752 [Chlamydomonas incerta]